MLPDLSHVERLPRYGRILAFLWRHGRNGIFDGSEEIFSDPKLQRDAEASSEGSPETFVADLESLGPTFVKLGQVLSTRRDLLPPAYIEALERLQDDVEPFEFEAVETILREELGVRWSKAFSELEKEPMAAASLGQVHRAKLRDGRPVAVKIQRPDIRGEIADDLDILESLAEWFGDRDDLRHVDLPRVVADLRRSLMRELDYHREAENLVRLPEILSKYESIVIPAPIFDYSTSRVLTMEHIDGVKITDLHPVARIEVDGEVLSTELFEAYLDQVLVHGFFHADPHPGNLLITPDHRLAILDLGMMARVPRSSRERLLNLLIALSEGRGDDTADLVIQMSRPLDDFDAESFRHQCEELIDEISNRPVQPAHISEILFAISKMAAECGLRLPRELLMLGKTLLHLDEIGEALDPRFDARPVIREHAGRILERQLREAWAPSAIFTRLGEVKNLVEELPRHAQRLFSTLGEDGLRLDVNAIDEELLIEGFQKIANRITSGLIVAALIIGAAMLMQVPSSFQILGYPGLAILLFFFAVAGGVSLLWSILRSDRDPG